MSDDSMYRRYYEMVFVDGCWALLGTHAMLEEEEQRDEIDEIRSEIWQIQKDLETYVRLYRT